MIFNSLTYLVFLPLVFLLFYLCNAKWRWLALLLLSLVFYAVLRVPYLLGILLLVSGTTFLFGRKMGSAPTSEGKRAWLWSGMGVNVSLLISLKYLPFIFKNTNLLFNYLSLPIHLPDGWSLVTIGVSYYVFQAISYLIDIYLEVVEPEQHFGYFTLYLGFFPKLMQGPIERAGDLLPQLRAPYVFDYEKARSGLLLFLWGLFKKMVVADRLALFVNEVYGHIPAYSGISLAIATYFYAIQLYCDFSGYTDMALGSARLFNINLTQNFNNPYSSTSIAEFWRRWHISFSRWILSYLFTPLQMVFRQWRTWGTALALLITFFISGVWHGASWCFIVWGLLHGLYLAISTIYKKPQKSLYQWLHLQKTVAQRLWQKTITFHLVCFTWIFFRATTLSDALAVVRGMVQGFGQSVKSLRDQDNWQHTLYLGQIGREFWLAIFFMVVVLAVNKLRLRYESLAQFLQGRTSVFRWSLYYALAFSILVFAIYNSNTFVYFQF